MEKNTFLMINNFISELYNWNSLSDIHETFFHHLNMIVPFSYVSLFLYDENADNEYHLAPPICFPSYFEEAEGHYLSHTQNDQLLWILHGKESTLIKESDVLDDEHRLTSTLYLDYYQKFNVYDNLQYTIVYNQKLYGVLTLFRTRSDLPFSSDDRFYLYAIGQHLNLALYKLYENMQHPGATIHTLTMLQEKFELTPAEVKILEHLMNFEENKEIADVLGIRENTLQKHLQNLFRKINVSSKWELMGKILK